VTLGLPKVTLTVGVIILEGHIQTVFINRNYYIILLSRALGNYRRGEARWGLSTVLTTLPSTLILRATHKSYGHRPSPTGKGLARVTAGL